MKASKTRRTLRGSNIIQRTKTVVIVPTYNEIENLKHIYARITTAYKALDILIIDDGSPDGTGFLADKLAVKDKRVKVLHRSGKLGLGSAVIEGFRYALSHDYKLIITIDADLSHDPSNIPKMISLMGKYDLIIGSRYVRDGGMVNWSIGRLLVSMFANYMLKKILGLVQKDCSGGFKCFTSDLLRKINIDRIISKGYVFYVEILYRAVRVDARILELPIIFTNRDKGKSKLGLNEVLGYAINIMKLRCLTLLGKL